MKKKIVIVGLLLGTLLLAAIMAVNFFLFFKFQELNRPEIRPLSSVPFTSEGAPGAFYQEVPGLVPIDLSIGDFGDGTLTLEWRESVEINHIRVFSYEDSGLLFSLEGQAGIPQPYKLGSVPPGFQVTQGRANQIFDPAKSYRFELEGKEAGREAGGEYYWLPVQL